MTNYRRLISYIYAYEGNTKGKNIGFAKLESRNGQCKLSVNVKKVYVGSSDLEVYLLAPGKEISLGSIFIRGGSGEFRSVISVENAGDSGCGLDQCYGLTIHEKNDSWRAYTTIWEDAVAHAAEVELADVTSGNLGNSEKQIHKKVEELAEEINDGILSSSGGLSLPETVPLNDSDQETVELAWKDSENQPAAKEETPDSPGDGQDGKMIGAGSGEQIDEDGSSVQMADNTVYSEQEENTMDGNPVQEEYAPSGGGEASGGEEPPVNNTTYKNNQSQTILHSTEAIGVDNNLDGINYTEPGKPRSMGGGRSQPVVMPDTAMWQRERTYRLNRHSPLNMPVKNNGYADSAMPENLGRAWSSEPFSRADTRYRGESQRPPAYPGTSTQMQPTDPARPTDSAQPTDPVHPTDSAQPTDPARPTDSAQPTDSVPPTDPARTQPAMENNPFRQSQSARQKQWIRQNRPVRTVQQLQPGQSTQKVETDNPEEEKAEEKALVIDSHKEEILPGNPQELERLEQEEQENLGPRQLWEGFQKRYPKIQAFESANGCEILTVKPQDIGLLPRENWNYGNNSFLLHGYYNYRYLILARIGDESKGRTRYILGVPGHYYSNEKYMASMFGFPHFVLSKKQPSQDGRFGYWYTDVRMQNQD